MCGHELAQRTVKSAFGKPCCRCAPVGGEADVAGAATISTRRTAVSSYKECVISTNAGDAKSQIACGRTVMCLPFGSLQMDTFHSQGSYAQRPSIAAATSTISELSCPHTTCTARRCKSGTDSPTVPTSCQHSHSPTCVQLVRS
jgi:hypothetical protein